MSALLDLRRVAIALGGRVCGSQVVAPGPNHSPRDQSLSVRLSRQAPDGFVVFSHAGDPFEVCRDYVAAKLGIAREGRRAERSPPTPLRSGPASAGDTEARIALAVAL